MLTWYTVIEDRVVAGVGFASWHPGDTDCDGACLGALTLPQLAPRLCRDRLRAVTTTRRTLITSYTRAQALGRKHFCEGLV